MNLHWRCPCPLGFAVAGLSLFTANLHAEDFPAPFDTEESKKSFFTPQEAVQKLKLPDGFSATLFAGEPDVRQPIGFTTDDRGRLWIAENYTYSDNGAFDQKLRDRIVILEDADHNGVFDKRTVFWDQGQKLTSVAIGFGGVWALCAPNLYFIPDQNGDDVPDGPPEAMLDGWATENIQHNIVNGLMWGPDGWLYGRHGILATSSVGRPGTPKKERQQINCGIWRFHPVRKMFEVVAHGTTNPWGMDFDQHGEAFFINTVIGHLFHVIPGAHYRRMYGQDMDPHSYELIDQHADHYHWDTGEAWQKSRDGKGANDVLGGGHAHSGLMIYLGDNWPERYRNSIFTVNLHGYRLNNDIIERRGSGYVGKHGTDFTRTSDIWFRAVDLAYGADGGVFVLDWSDTGECHEADGVHRSSGRIYKIVYGKPEAPVVTDLTKLSDSDLVAALFHKNQWYGRRAQRILQERAAFGRDLGKIATTLEREFDSRFSIPQKLQAMWALHAVRTNNANWLLKQLKHPNEYVRIWAVRFLTEQPERAGSAAKELQTLARSEKSAPVRLALASALQRLPLPQRSAIAEHLLAHSEDANDHNLPLMIWYGISPLGESAPASLVELSSKSRIPLVRKLIARRLAERIEKNRAPLDALVSSAADSDERVQSDVVQGISEALRGWQEADMPKGWTALRESLNQSTNAQLKQAVRDLSLLFGDETVLGEMKRMILDDGAEAKARQATLQRLIEQKRPDLLPFLQQVITDKALTATAARGLAAYDDPNAPAAIIDMYPKVAASGRPDLISALVSRPKYAGTLLNAVSAGKIPRADISAYHARQIKSFNDSTLNQRLGEVWGEIRKGGSKEKEEIIARYKTSLTAERLTKANLSNGRETYNTVCALCHKLYGEGAAIGPDLTGSGRSNLDYLLENILDPSAIVAADFKMVVITMKDGRILNGVVSSQTDKTVTIQGFTEKTALQRADIAEMKPSDTSMMPEGLLEGLDDTQTADLIAYLMSTEQVPLPTEKK